MNVRIPKLPAAVLSIWQRLAPRDRQAVSALGLVLLAVLVFVGLWQPAQARLAIAERVYQQRLVLAAEVSRAQAPNVRGHDTQPLAVRLSERAGAARNIALAIAVGQNAWRDLRNRDLGRCRAGFDIAVKDQAPSGSEPFCTGMRQNRAQWRGRGG